MAFSLHLDEFPEYWHLALAGELDYAECSQLRLSIHRILQSDVRSAIVDLGDLDYLDSSGLGILLAMAKEYAALGGHLVLVTNKVVNELLTHVRVGHLFATAPTSEAALELLRGEELQLRYADNAQ